MPKYHDIFLQLTERIRSGIYPIGKNLPGEHQLMNEFCVSRDTIRKALSLLSRQGYIEKSHGRGSVVIAVESSPSQGFGQFSFSELISRFGSKTENRILEMEQITPDEKLRGTLNITQDTPVYRLKRVRYVNGLPYVLEIRYFNGDVSACPTREQAENSIYYFIETVQNIPIGAVRRITECRTADEEISRYLEMPEGKTVIYCTMLALSQDGQKIMFTEAYHEPDKYHYEAFIQRSMRL